MGGRGAAAHPGRNSNTLGGNALIGQEEPERGILMSLPQPRRKYIKQMNFRATIVNKERRLGGTKKDFLFNLSVVVQTTLFLLNKIDVFTREKIVRFNTIIGNRLIISLKKI